MLDIRAISKQYDKRGGPPVEALTNVDLSVASGEFVTLMGPSGSGKSTLLFTIGAMLQPTQGDVFLDGARVYSLDPNGRAALRRKSIGFMFQTFNLIPYLDAVQNVALPMMLAGETKRRARVRAAELLVRVGLESRQGHRPTELSVGERQRVALCRAIVNAPDLLLADEPTGNLDEDTAAGVIGLLLQHRDAGLTIILATHDRRVADVGTRRLTLEAGRLLPERPEDELEPAC